MIDMVGVREHKWNCRQDRYKNEAGVRIVSRVVL